MTELIWDGKYKDGKKQGPVRVALPFQTVETVNESAQDRRRTPSLSRTGGFGGVTSASRVRKSPNQVAKATGPTVR